MLLLQIKYITLVILISLGQFAASQINLDNKLILNGSTNDAKQVSNISSGYDSTNLLSVNHYQSNYNNFIQVTGIDTLVGNTNITFNPYTAGTQLFIKIDTSNQGPVSIDINGLGIKHLFKNISDSLSSGDLIQNEIVPVIYDGISFHLIKSYKKQCPSGTVSVNEKYCISQDEEAWKNWWDASDWCHQRGGALCTWTEWYYACQKTGLGLIDMTDNLEWLNCPVNNPNNALGTGNGGCKIGNVAAGTANLFFRCCFQK